MNNAISKIAVPSYGSSVVDTQGRTGVAKFDPNTGQPLTPTSSADNPVAPVTKTQPVPKYGETVVDAAGNKGVAKFDPNTGLPLTQTGSDAGGANGGSSGDGSSSGSDNSSGDSTRDAIDPSLRGIYDSSMGGLDQGIANAKSTLDSARSTLQNDPAATNAVNMIEAKYDQQIQLMKDKNTILLGSAATNAARNGSLQYANEMETNFMSDEQGRAAQRVDDLITTEAQMVLKTQQSYQAGDVKAFDAASKALDAATKAKSDAINKLLDETDKVVKEKQAQAKITAAAAKQKMTDSMNISKRIAPAVVSELAGMKNKEDKDNLIQQVAAQYGIDPGVLQGDVAGAQQTSDKTKASLDNIASEINKRNSTPTKNASTKGNGTDGAYKYTADDVATYASLMNKGGKSPNGVTYAPRGSDGFVDPGAYTAAFNDWISNGGTSTGFAKKFPVKGNVNPDSYGSIPAALKPKADSTSTSQYQL